MKNKIGVLLINIGTPSQSDTKSVRKYLEEFLTDPDVVNAPSFVRNFLMKGFVIPRRAPKSAQKYQKIWTHEGSPLLVESIQFCNNLQSLLGDQYQVVIGMRYGVPSLENALQTLIDCSEIIFCPLYPQYAEATTGSTIKKILQICSDEKLNPIGLELLKTFPDYKYNFVRKDNFPAPKIRVLHDFFSEEFFIQALVDSLSESLINKKNPRAHWLFSFHGLPQSQLKRISGCYTHNNCCEEPSSWTTRRCYRAQCLQTAKIVAEKLGLTRSQWSVSFQSRLGPVKWIRPYTDELLTQLPKKEDVEILTVVAPAFVVDGLETLEEISIEGRQTFLSAGGKEFHYIPCLNHRPSWVHGFADYIKRNTNLVAT